MIMCSTKIHSTSISAFFIRLLMVLASVTFSVNAFAAPQVASPSTGSNLSGLEQKFSWNSGGTNVEQYWLYVGTKPGAANIANSGDLGKATEYDVFGIPTDGSTVYARLWYYSGSTWSSVDSSYKAPDLDVVNPSNGSTLKGSEQTLNGSEQTFSWNFGGVDVEKVWLYVGTTPGGRNIADSGDLGKGAEFDVIGIPMDGSTIHVRLWYYLASRWFYVDNSYTAADLDLAVSPPTMDSPAKNSEIAGKIAGTSVDFKWSNNNTPVNFWWLWLGTTKEGSDIYDSGRALRTRTSVTVDDLPVDGSPIYARLWFRTTSGWEYADSVYQTKSGSDPGPEPEPVDAELDMTRLLMQGSFGPTIADIENGLQLGGPAEWIDAQMALPAGLHLPIATRLWPEGTSEPSRQRGRYQAFWQQAIRSDDQLRQRVAFALSQIFVVSDKAAQLQRRGNLVAKYYDILVQHSFGNFRQLLNDVTLSPAMGRYLGMLGNEKPDESIGIRADENYAREVMQLFTIGLVGLNLDGSERAGEVTYTQSDVENAARALTGWYWDTGEPEWKFARYRPNEFKILEAPMVAYPQHHDTDAKVFMGNTLPAGQTAEQDLKMVLDILFNHPNVGPFIGEQLIKRLVTSNPSRGYVRRVARAFNNNGSGVRGDMAAVVKAILLDDEARNPSISNRTDFGKLREPILRYAHMWRAFDADGAFAINIHHRRNNPQIAPFTAPSVFNFYSPSFAPQGTIADAGLVAPEFQINSEAASNTINSRLIRAVKDDAMYGEDTLLTLDLGQEEQLLESSAEELIDHLDLLLTARTLTADSRKILTEYIDSNKGRVDSGLLLREVIGLVVTSTEYAIQR